MYRKKPLRHRIVQCKLALLDQPHRGGGHDRLRHGGKTEDPVLGHGAGCFTIAQSGRSVVDELAAASDENDRAYESLLIDRAVDDAVQPRGERVVWRFRQHHHWVRRHHRCGQ
jgi:hypothetical protein